MVISMGYIYMYLYSLDKWGDLLTKIGQLVFRAIATDFLVVSNPVTPNIKCYTAPCSKIYISTSVIFHGKHSKGIDLSG
jgi:hypothetical protein